MILRLDQKLAKKAHAGPLTDLPVAGNPYADWTARLFTAERSQFILLCNTAVLYGTLFYGRGITDVSTLIARGLASLRETARDDGLSVIFQDFIAPHTGQVCFAKTLNRSVTGSVNERVAEAKFFLTERQLSPAEVCKHLNGRPLSAIAGKKHAWVLPHEAIKNLLGQ